MAISTGSKIEVADINSISSTASSALSTANTANTTATNAYNLANSKQDALGFTPVQQGGGAYQGANKIYIGWDGGSLRCQVDATDLGAFSFGSVSVSQKVATSLSATRSGSVYSITGLRANKPLYIGILATANNGGGTYIYVSYGTAINATNYKSGNDITSQGGTYWITVVPIGTSIALSYRCANDNGNNSFTLVAYQ